jgi:hypothetical protein
MPKPIPLDDINKGLDMWDSGYVFPSHGGQRKNAGRKCYGFKQEYLQILVPSEIKSMLKSYCKEQKQLYIKNRNA